MFRRHASFGALAAAFACSTVPVLAAAQTDPTENPPPPPPADVVPPTPPPSPADASPQINDKADALFAKANEAFDKGQLEEAYSLYKQAFSLKRTYDIAGNLGQVELKLGRFRDAAEHLDFTLRMFPPTGKSEPREAIRSSFEAAKKEVGALAITVNVKGASVSIDGKSIGLSPFEARVFVEPGKRTIEASLEAHLPTRISLEIAKNESRDLSISLTPKNAPPPPPRNVPLLLTGFGLSLAAAGTGIGLMIAATGKGTEADGLLQTLVASEPDGKCPCGSSSDRVRLKGLRQDHDLFFNAATGMFIGAGVLALGATAYALSPSFQKARTARLVPVVSTLGGGAVLIGSF